MSINFTIVSAVNNEAVLQSCLLSSPCLGSAAGVLLKRGFNSAARAYNSAIDEAKTDVLVFAHQDVFLPVGWDLRLQQVLKQLSDQDPDWAVAGVWGVHPSGNRSGHLFCVGLGQELGGDFVAGHEVRTLDEVLLIVRKSSGVRFDEALPGYHFYGTDICLEAERLKKKCYAISAFCIHNTNGYALLPWDFWKRYFWMRRKWKNRLPIITPCTKITSLCWPILQWNIGKWKNILLGRDNPGKRVANPGKLYQDLVGQIAIPSRHP